MALAYLTLGERRFYTSSGTWPGYSTRMSAKSARFIRASLALLVFSMNRLRQYSRERAAARAALAQPVLT